MSNTIKNDFYPEDKYLEFLTRKDFKIVLDNQNIDIETYNCLYTAHMATVVAQSQGVKYVRVSSGFETVIASMNKNNVLNIPRPKCDFRVELTNRGYITRTAHTGSKITVWHKNDFDFYRSPHLKKWMNYRIQELKSFTEVVESPSTKIEIIVTKLPKTKVDRERENNLIIYTEVVEKNLIVKSFLNHYFLTNDLPNKNSLRKKIKI